MNTRPTMVAGGRVFNEQEQHRLSSNKNGILGAKSQMHRLLQQRILGTTPTKPNTSSVSLDEPLLKGQQLGDEPTEEDTLCTCGPPPRSRRRMRRRVRAQQRVAPMMASSFGTTPSSAGEAEWSTMSKVATNPAVEIRDETDPNTPLLDESATAMQRTAMKEFLESSHILAHFPLGGDHAAHTMTSTMLTSFTVEGSENEGEDDYDETSHTASMRSSGVSSVQVEPQDSCQSFCSTGAMAGRADSHTDSKKKDVQVLPISTIRLYHGEEGAKEEAELQLASQIPLAPVKENTSRDGDVEEQGESQVDSSYQLQLETERQELQKRKNDMLEFSMRRSCGLLLDLSQGPQRRLRSASSTSTTSLSSASSSESSSTCFYSVSGMPSAATVRVLHQQQQTDGRQHFSSIKSQSYTDRIEQRMNRRR